MKLNAKLIEYASQALIETEIVKGYKYSGEFNGYISSLGAAIIQSGLLPAMIFFENKDSEAKERHKIIDAVKFVINKKRKTEGKDEIMTTVSKYIIESDDRNLLLEITDAATALKLALRMYEKQK
jgi:CRISPR-associated protein Cmr5